MCTRIRLFLTVLSMFLLALAICSCSILVSTPPTAKIRIQGLDNKLYEYIVTLDKPVDDTNVEFRITKRYTLQLDFEWLWDSGAGSHICSSPQLDEDATAPLVPWIVCNYRF